MYTSSPSAKSYASYIFDYFLMALGAFFAAFAIEVFLIPNKLIDGGIVGVAMIFANLFGQKFLPLFLLIFNLPFLYLAYRSIGKVFLWHMLFATIMFAGSLVFIHQVMST